MPLEPNELHRLLRKELEQLIVVYPLVSNQAGEQPDGNAILYVGDLVYVWRSHFDIEPWLGDLVRVNYIQAKIESGRISRGRHKLMDNQSHDDFIGLAYAAQETGNGWIADEIIEHGRKTFWNYEDPTEIKFRLSIEGFKEWFQDWHFRFPGQTQHYKLCSTKYQYLNWFDRFWFSMNFFFSKNRINGGGHKMELLMRKAYLNQKERYWLCDWALKVWEKKIRKLYPNLTGDMMQVYFDRDDELKGKPNHVFARWMQGLL